MVNEGGEASIKLREIIELRALRKEWEYLTLRIDTYLQIAPKKFITIIGERAQINEKSRFYMEIKGLEEDYQDLVSRTCNLLKLFNIKEDVLPKHIHFPTHYEDISHLHVLYEGETIAVLYRMAKECAKVLEIIDGLIWEVVLLPRKEKELKALEEKIKQEIEPALPHFASELINSINSLRKGCFLGSVLICGRVVTYLIEKVKAQIPNLSSLKGEERWQEVIRYLKSKKIIVGDEGKRILEALKLYRHKFAHTLGAYPSLEEVMLMISGTTFLVKKISSNVKEFSFLFP